MISFKSGFCRCNIRNSLLLFIIFTFIGSGKIFAQDSGLKAQARSLINLLDYVSQDYAGAVKDGKIINESEYNEMMEFSGEIVSLFDSISLKTKIENKAKISTGLRALHEAVEKKTPEETFAQNAQQWKKQIMLLGLIDLAPVNYPDIAEGAKLYAANCATCHGKNGAGNGPGAIGLNPKPTDFLAISAMKYISPLQVFNTARLGVQGTAMLPFDNLSDDQVWQIAFYVKSLPYQNQKNYSEDTLKAVYKRLKSLIPLSELSHLSDVDVQTKLPENEKESGLLAIRLHQASKSENTSLQLASLSLDEALELYRNNQPAQAGQKALLGYLNGVEPVEQQLRAIDANIVNELETNMLTVRTSIKKGKSVDEVEANINKAKVSIAKASQLIGEQTFTFWFSFLIAASILLREGLEAVLVIITILSLLKSLNAKRAMNFVHSGWVTALAIGIASWFLTGWLISFGPQNREMIEGYGSVIAVVILIYVGFWLHNKTEAEKWQHFVSTRITKLLDEKKMFGLAIISFVVVFREAFESILFLSSLQLQVDKGSQHGVWMGALTSIIVVILIAYLLLHFSVRIPIRKLFQYSAFMIMVFAIVLAGEAVHAFQEAGYVSVTSIPMSFHSAVLGIFPTVETLSAQAAVVIIFSFMWWRRTNNSKVKEEFQKA